MRRLGSTARRLGIRFVLLKGGALLLMKLVRAEKRPMSDLDVLLEPAEAQRFSDALVTEGWKAEDLPRNPYHLAPLLHPAWPPLELHDCVPGLTRSGRSWASCADLDRAGSLESLPGFEPCVLVPSREVLAAHAVAHGFYQHAVEPPFYPNLRVFDDLRALGALDLTDEEFLAGPGRWIWRALSPDDIRTILHLGRRLHRGEDVAADSPPTAESRLLEHVRRRQADPQYREASRLGAPRLAISGPTPVRSFLQLIRTATFLSRGQVDEIYGRPGSAWGYAFRRLARPADLVLRAGRYTLLKLRPRAGMPNGNAARPLPAVPPRREPPGPGRIGPEAVGPFRANPDVSCREEEPGQGAILFNPGTDAILAINATGLLLWRALEAPATRDELVRRVMEACEDAAGDQVAADVGDFIEALLPGEFIGEVVAADA